ncbi:Nucleoside diphosphate kinase-like domain,Nucleoside diphosphate kinase,Dpy-30 [Cinara cedri]|uniref:Nucleoside diphosphate kinase-like domain,Nucleoside diphosphate kinase,Dpy-30 n=1 Tax=Cinara cedri TaxID=506608 RepID=A0A5E4MZ33_9HEMI|nr:Nucleoside diphosphate kinase-like domain,Nucleoside diphosphate kinase,Dpy-30 [Cinara cedri]
MLKGSDNSLGTRALPEKDKSVNISTNSFCQISDLEPFFPVTLSDVSLFGDSEVEADGGHKFQRTLAIIKPEAVHLMYKIECVMERNGFIVIRKEVLRLTRELVAEFYREHALELYFPRLVDHMSGKPVAVYILSKKNCVDEWRRLIGPADVRLARRDFPVSLRAIFSTKHATDCVANVLHGSDSLEAAKREISFFFPSSKEEITDPNDIANFIQLKLMPTIAEGLSEMAREHPLDQLRWFANWLKTKTLPV